MATFHTAFLGCKVSQADSEAAASELAAASLSAAGPGEPADICVLMSCCVTAEAERKSRQLARRLARSHRRVIVGGCAARLRPDQFRERGIEPLDGRPLATLVGEALTAGAGRSGGEATKRAGAEDASATRDGRAAPRTRLMLKVQDGCPQSCAFCTVRLARGQVWSLPVREAVRRTERAVAAGCGEVVLTGVNLGVYRDEMGVDLAGLIERLVEVPGLERLRLSSLEPNHLRPRLLRALAHEKVARHLHVPLQSAADRVLRDMNRPYTFAEYGELVGAARVALGDDLALTTDVIVGYPTEDESAFAATLAALEGPEALFDRVHVFPYSPRPGTPAERLPVLPPVVVRERAAAALRAAAAAQQAAARRALGKPAAVLMEERRDGMWRGYSSQYVRYYVEEMGLPDGFAGAAALPAHSGCQVAQGRRESEDRVTGADLRGRLVRVVGERLFRDGLKGRIL